MTPVFSVIICTYRRPDALGTLLNNLIFQTVIAHEIIVVDASEDYDTQDLIKRSKFLLPLKYIHAGAADKGLTKQRNLGVLNLSPESEVTIFLDDDIIPERDFFEKLLSSFEDKNVVGSMGYITNESSWKKIENKAPSFSFVMEGYYLPLHKRDKIRAILGLYPYKVQPGKIPLYGHGKDSLPPTGKSYIVDHIMGGITAYRNSVLKSLKFSEFFEGYGLYEDFDFSVRASKMGVLISNTSAKLEHHHHAGGRPNTFKLGMMVVKNGWYVWRLKHPKPGIINIFKWHCITLLLTFIRGFNTFSLNKIERSKAFNEWRGRMYGWLLLLFIKPKLPK